MSLLDRYILREVLRTTLLTASVLVTVIAFGAAIKPLANENLLTLGTTMKYITLAIVPMLQFALPFAAGFAGTLSLHRMASDNEIVAAATGGISYARLLRPIVLLGLALTLIMLVLTQWVVPRFWARLEAAVAADVTRMFQSSIERGEAFELGDRQIFADRLLIDPSPPANIDTRLTLFHVVAAELNDDGGIDKDVTATRAIVDIYRRPAATFVKIAMRDAVAYDPEGGVLANAPQLESRTIVIPSGLNVGVRHKTRRELLAIRRNPDINGAVDERRLALAEALRNEDVWNRIGEKLAAEGTVDLVSQQENGPRFRVYAAAISGGYFFPKPGELVAVVQESPGRADLLMRTADARLDRHAPDPLSPVSFDLYLNQCEVSTLGDADTVNRRNLIKVEGLTFPAIEGTDYSSLSTDELLEAHGKLPPETRERLEATADNLRTYRDHLRNEITGRLHKHYALSITPLLLILLGCVLAMWLRGSLPLTIYLWSFMPSIVDLITISSGEHMIRDGYFAGGFTIMWAGNAALVAIIASVYWKLSRH